MWLRESATLGPRGGEDMLLKRPNRKAFTLIELVIVIAIIIILVVILILVIIPAFMKGRKSDTLNVFNELKGGIQKWQGTRSNAVFPAAVPNFQGGDDKYAGNKALYKALVEEPKSRGDEPYIKLDERFIKSGMFVDGWGEPIVYWEWSSKTAAATGSSESPGSKAKVQGAPVPAWATNKGSYDLFSSGVDKTWGTKDDLDAGGTEFGVTENNVPKSPIKP